MLFRNDKCYNYENGVIDEILARNPDEHQWWITGFNPDTVGEADVSKQVMISSVKFENNELLYDSLKKTADPSSDMYNQDLDKFGIFDDNNNTLWLMWYGESSL